MLEQKVITINCSRVGWDASFRPYCKDDVPVSRPDRLTCSPTADFLCPKGRRKGEPCTYTIQVPKEFEIATSQPIKL